MKYQPERALTHTQYIMKLKHHNSGSQRGQLRKAFLLGEPERSVPKGFLSGYAGLISLPVVGVPARKGIDTLYLCPKFAHHVSRRNEGKPEGSVTKGFLSGYAGLISVPGGSISVSGGKANLQGKLRRN